MAKTKKQISRSEVYTFIEPGPVVMVTTKLHEKMNVMSMSWHMMVEFTPPLIACIISDQNYTFEIIKKTKECVINIPTKEMVKKVIEVGNVSGRKVDKFKKFKLLTEKASLVKAPLLSDCYVSLECKVIDTKMATKYNLFLLEVVKAWMRPSKTKPRMIHHAGYGKFIVDGDVIKLPSSKK
jgi:flavin reductase (DIM6/NTAB) family NADH-FMN oxidoreductase RutF